MPHQQPTYEPTSGDQDEWDQELPRRPRRRLLGVGGSPIPLALLAVLLTACGFIGGVLVEKGQGSSGSSASTGGLASRLAALRGGATGGGARGSAAASFLGSGARPTAGQVAYLHGGILYVTDAEGNTVKVTTSTATAVSKTVSSTVKDIHPGETVTVTGPRASNGAISAESISVGAASGGLAGLFGAGGGARSGAGSTSTGAPALFGGG
jgi:hypothetical protein